WQKHPSNPIIPTPQPGEPGHGVYGVFDPFLFLLGDQYVCLLSANRLPNGKDTQYVMTSPDLINWTPRHPLYEHADPQWTLDAEDCSCPDFFQLGDRHVLLCISHNIGTRCYVGRFDEQELKFHPDVHQRMNWPGGTFFAPESLRAPDGRRLFWGWVTDVRVGATRQATGSGVQSLPRVMEPAPDGGLLVKPAVELEALRRNPRALPACEVANTALDLPEVVGNTLELQVEIDPGNATAAGLQVCCSPDGREGTTIWYDAARGRLLIDMTFATLRDDVSYCTGPVMIYGVPSHAANKQMTNTVEAPFALAAGQMLKLRVFLDGPVLEVFANDRQCVTTQIFPALPESRQVHFAARGGTARLVSGQAWDMAAIEMVNHKGN
ncbi:MAG: glycoside hydrolase family 32 protein, partial [Armatimonadetes bacterium]|nr:glycoside hydrolase family 32 protein [Armatimonadota bacterium]